MKRRKRSGGDDASSKMVKPNCNSSRNCIDDPSHLQKKKSGKNKNLENKFWGNKIETKNSLQKLKKKSNQIKNKENQKLKKKIDFLFHF